MTSHTTPRVARQSTLKRAGVQVPAMTAAHLTNTSAAPVRFGCRNSI